MKVDLTGAGVALITPFNESGDIDFESLKNLLKHVCPAIDYLVVLGTTGESVTLTNAEKERLIDFIKTENGSNLPLILGVGGNNTSNIIQEMGSYNLDGYAAILSVSPYYNKPSQNGIIEHYTKIADNSALPIILYNVPSRTGSNLLAETTLKLAEHQNIIATKEASGNLEQAIKIAAEMPEDFQLISGDDLLTLPLLSIGATGVISVLANAYPSIFQNMVKYYLAGDIYNAKKELHKIIDLNPLMYAEGNPVGVKYILQKLGICKEEVRLPMTKASKALKSKIEEALL